MERGEGVLAARGSRGGVPDREAGELPHMGAWPVAAVEPRAGVSTRQADQGLGRWRCLGSATEMFSPTGLEPVSTSLFGGRCLSGSFFVWRS